MEVRFAKAKAGHDKNHIYMVKEEKDGFVFLINGITKCVTNPKKKAKKHVQMIKYLPKHIETFFLGKTEISDEMVAYALKEYAIYTKQDQIIIETEKNRNQED